MKIDCQFLNRTPKLCTYLYLNPNVLFQGQVPKGLLLKRLISFKHPKLKNSNTRLGPFIWEKTVGFLDHVDIHFEIMCLEYFQQYIIAQFGAHFLEDVKASPCPLIFQLSIILVIGLVILSIVPVMLCLSWRCLVQITMCIVSLYLNRASNLCRMNSK